MKVTELAVKRPVAVFILLLTLVIFAFDTLTSFKMASMPDVELPMFIVQTPYIGANPETIEELVTKPIAEIGKAIEGFDEEITSSQANMSRVILRFKYGTDMDEAYMDLKTALDRVALPEDASDPILVEMSMNASSVLELSLNSETGSDLTGFIDEALVPEIETLTGVAQVDVYGSNPGYVRAVVDEVAMSQYGIVIAQVTNAIKASEYTVPGGDIQQGNQIISVSTMGEIDTLAELANTPITTPSGQIIKLSDVAKVEYVREKLESASRYNGEDNLSVSVTATQDANVPQLTEEIVALANRLLLDTSGIEMDVTFDEGQNIVDILVSVAETLLLGIGLCMVVLFIFFGDIRASLIVGSSMPISLLMALIMMGLANFELNSITAVALIIAIGMIVDSSIVVLESMFTAKNNNASFVEAAIEGCKSVGTSLIASTITTIVVYLPLAFMAGMSGQMFSQLGFTIVFSMIASIVSAITIVPFFYVILKPTEKKDILINKLINFMLKGYDKMVRVIVNQRILSVITAIAILAGTIGIMTQVPMEMMPTMDEGYFNVTARFRPGTDIEIISEEVRVIEQMIAEDEVVENYYTTVRTDQATISVYLKEGYVTEEEVNRYMLELAKIPGMTIDVSAGGMLMPGATEAGKRTLTIEGIIYDDVEEVALDLIDELYTHPEITKINSSVSDGKTQAKIHVNQLEAAKYGLSVADIAGTIYMINGGMDAGEMTLSGKEVDIRVEYPEGQYDDVNKLKEITMNTQRGTVVLGDLIEVELTNEMEVIEKTKGKYSIDIEVVFSQEHTAKITQIINEIGTRQFPSGIALADASREEMMTEMMALGEAILLGTFLVFAVMAIQFESMRFSIMVMMSLVFGGIGAFALLFVANEPISMTSLMGFLMLVGLAVNNGILYVDRVNQLKPEMALEDALVEAGKSRIRPIFMTTMTTILSMMPVALGMGDAAEMLRGMALIIIGGLTSSTILVLLLLPTFYRILDKKPKKDKVNKKDQDREVSVA